MFRSGYLIMHFFCIVIACILYNYMGFMYRKACESCETLLLLCPSGLEEGGRSGLLSHIVGCDFGWFWNTRQTHTLDLCTHPSTPSDRRLADSPSIVGGTKYSAASWFLYVSDRNWRNWFIVDSPHGPT